MNRVFYLYKIINQVNQKIYIGQSVAPSARWYAHRNVSNDPKVPLQFAIKKYGAHNFEFEIIACCTNQEDANWTETELVKQYDSFIANGKGYNATLGGDNAPKTEEWKKKVSQTLMGHSVSQVTIDKLSNSHMGQVPWNKGIPWTEETLAKISKSLKGRSVWNKGVPRTEDLKVKQRKFSPKQELAIVNDNRSSRIIAKEYGVNKSTVLDIRKRNKT